MPYELVKHAPDDIREFRERQRHKRDDIIRRMAPPPKDAPIRDEGAEPEGLVTKPDQLLVSAATSTLVRDIAAKIQGTYPGWRWAIQPSEIGQIINIFNLDFHNEFGYTIRYLDVMHDPQRKEAIRAAGEILERFGYTHRRRPNGPLAFDRDAMARFQRDSKGNVLDVDLEATSIRNVSRQVQKRHKLSAAIRNGLADEVILENGERMLRVRN